MRHFNSYDGTDARTPAAGRPRGLLHISIQVRPNLARQLYPAPHSGALSFRFSLSLSRAGSLVLCGCVRVRGRGLGTCLCSPLEGFFVSNAHDLAAVPNGVGGCVLLPLLQVQLGAGLDSAVSLAFPLLPRRADREAAARAIARSFCNRTAWANDGNELEAFLVASVEGW